jgi:Mrp family chromosome partitioning ATPase
MTDQSKIPLPRDGNSLIERAVHSFGWDQFTAPAVPSSGRPAPRPQPVTETRSEQTDPPAVPVLLQAVPALETLDLATIAPEPQPASEPLPAIDVEPAQAPVEPHHAAHHVDRDRLRRQGFIVPEGSVTATLEEFRIVKRQLLAQAADLRRRGAGGAAQRVLICSPHPGEGKTYCAVNLALAIAAEKESEVLLVDADFAKPSVLSALGLPGSRGLMDALSDPSIDVADLVLGTDVPGLKILPAGDATNRDSEHLSSSRTAGVLDRLTANAPHRMVIFDSPPALAASPAAELAKYVGQALVVCRADRTGQQSLEDAISLLSGCPNIQLLLNAVSFSPSGRRFGAYYGYGA